MSLWNPWTIGYRLASWLESHLEPGRTIVELGSGAGTAWLAQRWQVWSVEHDPRFLDLYPSRYIHAPIENGWYSVDAIRRGLPGDYDLILVDGPPAQIGRRGFLEHMDIFRDDVCIILDDVNREAERTLCRDVAARLGRSYAIHSSSLLKKFAVIPAPASEGAMPRCGVR